MPHKFSSAAVLAIAFLGWVSLWAPVQVCAAINAGQNPAQTFETIPRIVQDEIAAHHIPGAVVEIGRGERTLYREAFGYREFEPMRVAMTPDTLFDLASLTKPVATAVAIMQLHEQGRIDLDSPAARYWPRFGFNGKAAITVRELLTHYSGLRPDLDLTHRWNGKAAAVELIEEAVPEVPPGTRYQYSDINFAALGEIVSRVSGRPLDVYCQQYIFGPLGMTDTSFRPSAQQQSRIAPTLVISGQPRQGIVHDPTAARMGGVAGHAGLFSTADDLAKFAQTMLGYRVAGARPILSSESIAAMSRAESPVGGTHPRGFGWDLGEPSTSGHDPLMPPGSYGHTGYTGTMLWIDPASATYVIILSNRTYPDGTGDAAPLRKKLLALVSNQDTIEHSLASKQPTEPHDVVATGLDVLSADDFRELQGARIGLITNQTGVTRTGLRNIDLFSNATDIHLVAIFSPEHGLYGDVDRRVASGREPSTALPLYSLYGSLMRPSDDMLNGIDTLVFDIQDAGARFYTYVTTMAYAMEAAARRGIDFYVLDRPNPINATTVQGPVMDPQLKSFTGYFPSPTRYGMTLGELALMFNRENHIGVRLHIIKMHNYRRDEWYDGTNLPWIAPSPNLRNLTEATLYPGVALLEGSDISVGRGTDTPFELIGAPWISSEALSMYLEKRGINGVKITPADFIPVSDRYKNQSCHGIRVVLENRDALDAPALGIELASALYRLYPKHFLIDDTLGMLGSRSVLDQIKSGTDPMRIEASWQEPLRNFGTIRAKYLLYR